ncbi:MAG: glyoxalase [Actinomycetota bacterium]
MRVVWLEITDDPDLWDRVGFDVVDGATVINGVEHRLIGAPTSAPDEGTGPTDEAMTGVVGWGVSGVPADVGDIAGIPTTVVAEPPPLTGEDRHPNGVYRTDHLVVRTPDTPASAAAFEALGLEIKGNRATASGGARVDMRFAWAGDTLLEIVGPPEPDGTAGTGARIAGIAYVSADLDGTAAHLGDWSTTPVDAVQPGRRIAALRSEVGSSVPMAFMTPHVKR